MAEKLTEKVDQSPSLSSAIDRFLNAVHAWTKRVLAAYPEGFTSDSHDGGTFMLPWTPYIRTSGDTGPLQFMRHYRDEAKRHFEETEKWLDGYWRRQEVHHGTEHFDLFLRALWYVDPEDRETVRQLEDAAEHIGNWKPGFPGWFDWNTGLFRSLYLGTEYVGEYADNVPDSVRMASLSLLAHDMTNCDRYLALARAHIDRWANALTGGEALPVALGAQGAVYSLGTAEDSYRTFAGAAPDDFSTNLPRAENLIASGVPDILLELWQKTGKDQYKAAAEKIIDIAATVVESPIAWQAQAAVRRYRDTTNSDRYDKRVRGFSGDDLRTVETLTIVPDVETRCVTGPLGIRGDKPDWLEQDGKPAPSPLFWALHALINGDEELLTRAVDLGLAHFHLAERVYGDVTHHGCGSRSLAAVCRGHGRLNGAGVVTEVLEPAMKVNERLPAAGTR